MLNRVELKVPPVVVVLLCALLMGLVGHLFPATAVPLPLKRWLALLLAACGGTLGVLGVYTFRTANTTIDPHAPSKASRLVTHGIYRYSRNPMYLGLFLVLFAWSIYLANPLALLGLLLYVVYMNRFQIGVEERLLHQKFGADFTAYAAKVRRWL